MTQFLAFVGGVGVLWFVYNTVKEYLHQWDVLAVRLVQKIDGANSLAELTHALECSKMIDSNIDMDYYEKRPQQFVLNVCLSLQSTIGRYPGHRMVIDALIEKGVTMGFFPSDVRQLISYQVPTIIRGDIYANSATGCDQENCCRSVI